MVSALLTRASVLSAIRTRASHIQRLPFSSTAAPKSQPVHEVLEGSSPTIFTKDFSLADRVALVGGGNRGLGLEGALALAEAGARAVYCVDLGKAPGEEWTRAQQYVSRIGKGRLEYISGDVRNQEQMWKIGQTIGDREGRMDACLAAAGITGDVREGLRIPEEQLQEVFDVNLKGALFTTQAAGQQMERFGTGGSVILISSIAGHVSMPGMGTACYEMSKAGIHQMARSLACELGTKGIRVNTISPGIHRTHIVNGMDVGMPDVVKWLRERNAMKRIAAAREIRGAVVWLASDASSYCTGADIAVDGGHTAC